MNEIVSSFRFNEYIIRQALSIKIKTKTLKIIFQLVQSEQLETRNNNQKININ